MQPLSAVKSTITLPSNKTEVLLDRVLRTLEKTEQSKWRYMFKAFLWIVPITLPLAAIAIAALIYFDPTFLSSEPEQTLSLSALLVDFFGAITLGPLGETLLMIVIFKGLRSISNRPLFLTLGSASIWACLHSLAVPLWGFVVFWSFFVMSYAYLQYEQKEGLKSAFWVTAGIHFLNNLFAAGIVLLLSLPGLS